jgi:hypothetical protein
MSVTIGPTSVGRPMPHCTARSRHSKAAVFYEPLFYALAIRRRREGDFVHYKTALLQLSDDRGSLRLPDDHGHAGFVGPLWIMV